MYGGRIRGQGTYGCVFQPALKCSNNDRTVSDPSKLGKITAAIDAKNEIRAAEVLRSLPNASDYVVLPEAKTCIPDTNQTDPDLDACQVSQYQSLDSLIQITMPWGGYPIDQIDLDYRKFDIYKFIEDILAAGAFLVLNDICHFDIGGNNMLFNNPHHNTPRLIDFGFAFQPSQLVQEDVDDRWRVMSTSHDTETPEVTLMIGAIHDLTPSAVAYDLQTSKPAVQRLITLCDLVPGEWKADLLDWSLKSKSFQQHDWLSCWKLYWPGFDAWSIGTVILEILEIQMAMRGFADTWSRRGEEVKTLLRSLCHGNPGKRLDAAEALSLWTHGAHPLISSESFGSEWVKAKAAARVLLS